MSSKKNNSAIVADFSPYRYEVDERSLFPTKIQNQSIRGQITFGIQLQTSPSKSNRREIQSKTETQLKKTHPNSGSNHTNQYNEAKEKL